MTTDSLAVVIGVSTGDTVAVRVRDVENPPTNDDPNSISTWSDPDRPHALPDQIERVVLGWQGELP